MIGLVLQGGGAKGGYHVGVWKALRELNVEIGAVTGTSVGALIGAFIVQDSFDEVLDLWMDMSPALVVKDDPQLYHDLVTKNVDLKNAQMYFDYLFRILKQKGLDIEPLQDLIEANLDEEKIRSSAIAFGLVTVSLSEKKAIEVFVEDIEEGKLKDYLLASSYLPAFKPQLLDGKKFIDGSFYDSFPINLMASKGIKNIIAVSLNSLGRVKPVRDKNLKVLKIEPSGDTGSIFEFDRDRSRRNIMMGYLDTMKSFGKLQGEHYFIKGLPHDYYFMKLLQQAPHDTLRHLLGLIGQEKGYPPRMIFEKLVPEMAGIVDLDVEASYGDLFLRIAEIIAASCEIDRLKVYHYDDFIRLVSQAILKKKDHGINWTLVPPVFRGSSLVQKTFKEDLLIRCFDLLLTTSKRAF